jgi:hypothetical protein
METSVENGGFEHPHDTPPYPFKPSPTSAHSSRAMTTWFCDAYAS